MNYKQSGKDLLLFQKEKGCQWFRVPEEELIRPALLGIEHAANLGKSARKFQPCPTCGTPVEVNCDDPASR